METMLIQPIFAQWERDREREREKEKGNEKERERDKTPERESSNNIISVITEVCSGEIRWEMDRMILCYTVDSTQSWGQGLCMFIVCLSMCSFPLCGVCTSRVLIR